MTRKEALAYGDDTLSFISGSIERELPGLYETYFGSKPARIVADGNTFEAAGRSVAKALESVGVSCPEPIVFPGSPTLEPDYRLAADLAAELREDAAIVAVGSGTLNDIVKVAAHEAGQRYMVVATAASVDGYTSPSGSMIVDGVKESVFCRAPIGVLADGSILAEAPSPMLSAGYADLASKITAGSDWIIADEVGAEPVDRVCWEMIQSDLLEWLSHPVSVDKVMNGLTLTGIGMQHVRKSRPASGAEHLMSHVWEMEHHTYRGESVSHGFKVGVATLATASLTRIVMENEPTVAGITDRIESWPSWEERKNQIERRFQSLGGASRIVEESKKKHLSKDELRKRLELIAHRWGRLRERVGERLVPYDELKGLLSEAGCPTTPESIGLTRDAVIDTFEPAGMLRNRYTILDLAREIGLFDDAVREIKDSSTYLR